MGVDPFQRMNFYLWENYSSSAFLMSRPLIMKNAAISHKNRLPMAPGMPDA
ncbi:hypothetical protein [Luteitalea sp. TBR-22]|uniref:hypothetical protein n=1 Tax=Luteitalea sp. TBR-22 TaxID=2802971 RepID=UPI001EF51B59|nr:hypothetical protein [Luteitalea sp. TBR-22]